VVIGDTLFVDGTPHKTCTRCGAIIRQHDAKKITFLHGWKYVGTTTKNIPTEHGFIHEVTDQYKPILHTDVGCTDCWNVQDRDRQNKEWLVKQGKATSSLVYFEAKEALKKGNE
jgi:hypothetical protein